MKKVFLLLICLFLLGGCARTPAQKQNDAGTAYTVVDSRGRKLSFDGKPARIACNYVFADEILLDLVEHGRIAGLSKWVHDPGLSSAAEQAKDVRGVFEPNVEAIVKLKPDLIFLPDTVGQDYLQALETMGLKIYVFKSAARLHEIPGLVRAMGDAVGERAQAEMLVAAMEQKLQKLRARAESIPDGKRRSALLFLRFGAIGGEGIIYNDVLTAIGLKDSYEKVRGKGTTGEGTSRILSKEEVVRANPDFFIMANWTQGDSYKAGNEQLLEIYADPAYATVNAVINKKAVIIPQSYVNCLSHRVADGMEKLAGQIYGDEW